MKSVGIFTYMLSNYGAVLQCYAFQRYLCNDKNLDVEVIDFTTDKHLETLKIFNHAIANPVIRCAVNFCVLLKYKQLARRKERTLEFKRSHIKFTRRYSTMDEILSAPPRKDVYVSGSDQVFNLNSDYYKVYYLGFEKSSSRKVAYAPSFGHSSFDNVLWNKIKGYLNDFDVLSCREVSGAKFLSDKTGRDVPVVVDPTLLLSKEEWGQVAVKPAYKKKYIFIYDLNGGKKLVDIAKRIKRDTGCDIVCLTGNVMSRYDVNKQIFDAGPGEFLGWIANAECVVTDSFHGTVFSIINQKPFYTYIAIPGLATRINNLLEITSLQSRIVTDDLINHLKFSADCNANVVRLNEVIERSKKFIKESISGIEE